MFNKIKLSYISSALLLLLITAGCKKGAFDINSPNPNAPSALDPTFVLPAALTTSAQLAQGGNEVFLDTWMGYWAISGDYAPNSNTLTYTINTDFFSNNWDGTYLLMENYKYIENYPDPKYLNYVAIAKIMEVYHYQRLVDLYNNIPYSEALNGGVENYPKFDDAKTVYAGLVDSLGVAVNLINSAGTGVITPGKYDVMYGGNMQNWVLFANTLKLKILMREAPAVDPSSQLSGLTTDDFISTDATINPGFSNSSAAQQSPFWNSMGYNTASSATTNNTYYRANSYAVSFYSALHDPRITLFYDTIADGSVKGRAFGSTALEHNLDISAVGGSTGDPKSHPGIGKGLLKSPSMPAMMLPASESYFLQTEAIQRGYLTGDLEGTYETAIAASFSSLGVPNVDAAVAAYVAQTSSNVDRANSTNPIRTIIMQKWAAMNGVDPLESYSDWRRLGIPTDVPVSIFPGTTAPHVPYRLLYPTSEYSYNSDNVAAQGSIDAINSKIFWMP